jgi:hypothetical protein
MSSLLTSVALMFATAAPAQSAEDASASVGNHLFRGVQRAHSFEGWRRPLRDEAMQEAWCLVLENHPEVVHMSAEDLRVTQVSVERKDGRTVELPLESRLYELGIKARNTVLKDNHLNRQTGYQPVHFSALEDDLGYQLLASGHRSAPATDQD